MTLRVLILCAALMTTSAYLVRASRPETVPARERLAGLPMQLGAWQGRDLAPMDDRVLAVLGVDDYINRNYFASHRSVSLYIGDYDSQRQGDTMHSPLNCLPGAGWNPVERNTVEVYTGGCNIDVNRIVILKGTDKQLVFYWYQSHGRVVASEYWGKIYTVLDALRNNRTDAALVRVMTPVEDLSPAAEAAAEQKAVDFVGALFPLLGRFLPE